MSGYSDLHNALTSINIVFGVVTEATVQPLIL